MKNVTQCIPVLMYLVNNSINTENCVQNGAFKICKNYDKLVQVRESKNHDGRLKLNASFNAIASYTFDELTINTLEMWSRTTGKKCVPRVISLSKKSLIGLNDLQSLELDCVQFSKESLTSGSESPFQYIQSLWHLRLSRVNFSNFPPEFFINFPRLGVLELINSNIRVISSETFKGVTGALVKLRIVDSISEMKPMSFKHFLNLKILLLSGSQLTQLSPGVFTGLNQLEYLDLSNNTITTLCRDIFQLPKLETLDLHGNAISKLQTNVFSHLKLRKLDLSFNQLQVLPEHVFCDVEHMQHLNLSNNRITTIPTQFFCGYVRLQTLDLSSNKISLIETAAFQGLHLQSLNLRSNNITVLGNYAFINLVVSGTLDLSAMEILEIRPDAFTRLTAELVTLCHLDNKDIAQLAAKGRIKQLFYDQCSGVTVNLNSTSGVGAKAINGSIPFTMDQPGHIGFIEGQVEDDRCKVRQQRYSAFTGEQVEDEPFALQQRLRELIGLQLPPGESFGGQVGNERFNMGQQGLRELIGPQLPPGESFGGQVDNERFNMGEQLLRKLIGRQLPPGESFGGQVENERFNTGEQGLQEFTEGQLPPGGFFGGQVDDEGFDFGRQGHLVFSGGQLGQEGLVERQIENQRFTLGGLGHRGFIGRQPHL